MRPALPHSVFSVVVGLVCCLGGIHARSCLAKQWFVAPHGDDINPGTLEAPLASLQRVQQLVAPGDVVEIRGGLYRLTEAQISRRRGIFARVIQLERSGTPAAPITYRAYRDERPVFDFQQVKPRNQRVTAFYVSGSWLRIEGLEVVGVQVTMSGHTQSICFESQGNHNQFSRLSMHDGQAIGIYHVRGRNNLFLNCDAWNNWDRTSENKKGGNVDGFGCHPTPGSVGNVFRGCRAWHNSDDGFDCISAWEAVAFEDCWAWKNGLSVDGQPLADGNGFKIGGFGATRDAEIPSPVPRHRVLRCIASFNRASGFYANHHPGGNDWIHNSSYRNGTDFNLLSWSVTEGRDVDGVDHLLVGNLSYGGRRPLARIDRDRCVLRHNSFDWPVPLQDDDFMSLDFAELAEARAADGSLPVIGFLRPRGSALQMPDRSSEESEGMTYLGAFQIVASD